MDYHKFSTEKTGYIKFMRIKNKCSAFFKFTDFLRP